MRTLNYQEKEIIIQIIRDHAVSGYTDFANIIDRWLEDIDINIDVDSVQIHISEQRYGDYNLIDTVRGLVERIAITVNLLKELESNNYIVIYQEADIEIPMRFGRLPKGERYITSELKDKNLREWIREYTTKTIIVGAPIIKYVENNFRTEEEVLKEKEDLQNAKNLRVAKNNLYAAILIGIFSIVVSFYGTYCSCKSCQSSTEQVVQMDSHQFNILEERINDQSNLTKEIERHVHELQHSEHLEDSSLIKIIQHNSK